MRKFIIIFSLIFTFCAAHCADAADAAKIRVNGQIIMPDVAPVMISNRTMVPVRFVAEALGAKVSWDEKTKTVIISTGDAPYTPPQNNTGNIRISVNGQLLSPDVLPVSVKGRVMVPVRFVAEALNCRVGWYAKGNTVTITGKDLTTDHVNIMPANGVTQETIDRIKDYAEKAYSKVSTDFNPPQGDFYYDIYVYPDHNSYVDGQVEIRRVSRDKAYDGIIYWSSPNIIGIDLSKFVPDTGNWLAWAFSSLNVYDMAGNSNKIPPWLRQGLGLYEYYQNTVNSLTTIKFLNKSRQTALDALAKGSLPKINEASNQVTFDYGCNYADYMAAKTLIDQLGIPKIKEMIKKLDSKSDFPSVFQQETGLSLEDFDYQVKKSLLEETKKVLQPTTIKVSLAGEGLTDQSNITIATNLSGHQQYYKLSVPKTTKDYYFVINPNGSVSCDYSGLQSFAYTNSNNNWCVYIYITKVVDTDKIEWDCLSLKSSYGTLYPDEEFANKDSKIIYDNSENLDNTFPDGNMISIEQ